MPALWLMHPYNHTTQKPIFIQMGFWLSKIWKCNFPNSVSRSWKLTTFQNTLWLMLLEVFPDIPWQKKSSFQAALKLLLHPCSTNVNSENDKSTSWQLAPHSIFFKVKITFIYLSRAFELTTTESLYQVKFRCWGSVVTHDKVRGRPSGQL